MEDSTTNSHPVPITVGTLPIIFTCADGVTLGGQVFEPQVNSMVEEELVSSTDYQPVWPSLDEVSPPKFPGVRGVVVIASATGVSASYYHRYARFLAGNGFVAITFDYRGIGESTTVNLKGFAVRWYQWGSLDIDAVLRWARTHYPETPLHFVGHSFGGFGVGLASESRHVQRILTVGAQHAYWRDYAPGHRRDFLTRWHVRMPIAALLRGYFDGKRRGWLEDLPLGVALDWARSRKDFTAIRPSSMSAELRANLSGMRSRILAIAATDDPFATQAAMQRSLSYTPHADARMVRVAPASYGCAEIGHFALFHSRFAETFWAQSLQWIAEGVNPWAESVDATDGGAGVAVSTKG